MRDWSGNKVSTYSIMGASNHSNQIREENDYYATAPLATELLCDLETFSSLIWEPACGGGHIAEVLKQRGYNVICSDLVDRGYGQGGVDFLKCQKKIDGDIITNPPYKYAKEFVEHALECVLAGHKVAMFLKIQFLEGKARKELFKKHPPKVIYVSSSRLNCAMNGDFDTATQSAVAYAWYIWEKGYTGDTIVRWFN